MEAATNVKATMVKTAAAMQAETIAKRRAIDVIMIKDELMTRMALELKMDAAVDLKEALVESEALVVERAALVAEMVAAGACAEVMAAAKAGATATKAASEKDAATAARIAA